MMLTMLLLLLLLMIMPGATCLVKQQAVSPGHHGQHRPPQPQLRTIALQHQRFHLRQKQVAVLDFRIRDFEVEEEEVAVGVDGGV